MNSSGMNAEVYYAYIDFLVHSISLYWIRGKKRAKDKQGPYIWMPILYQDYGIFEDDDVG